MDPKLEEILKNTPGAIRGARGVILPLGEHGSFYLTAVRSKEETEGLEPAEHFYLCCCSRNEIIRLRSLRNAHDYLLRYRANAVVDDARAARVFTTRSQGQKDWSLTKYYHSRDDARLQYLGRLPRNLRKQVVAIPAGCAYDRSPNAYCIRALLGDVVIVSEALEEFCYYMTAGIHGASFGIPSEDCLVCLVIAYRIMLGSEAMDFDIDPRGPLPIEVDREVRKRTEHQISFIYGHEYAHHLLGHLKEALPTSGESSTFSTDDFLKDRVIYSHALEFEADSHSVSAIPNEKVFQANVAAGGLQLLLYLNILESLAAEWIPLPTSASNTHPPSLKRFEHLLDGLTPKIRPSNESLDRMITGAAWARQQVGRAIAHRGPKILQRYGSLYLPTYKSKIGLDRMDF